MNAIMTIACKEAKTAFRDHIFLIITGLFVLLSIVSVYIGSSTKNAELQAYQQIVTVLNDQGAASIPSPPVIYPLSVLSNLISYVSMIGSVVAIFLGFDVFSGEGSNGTLKLMAVRPVSRDQLVSGKLAGGALVIGGLLVTILIFNLLLFVLVSGMTPDPNELLRLLCFFLIAFVYLMVFYGTTMLVSLKTRDSGYGFLLMMIVWLTITFVLPQLADSQRSFAYAQSATGQIITQVPADTIVSQMIELFSPAAQFQNIGQNLLQVIPETAGSGPGAVLFKQWVSLVAIVIPGLAVLFFTYLSARKVEVL